MDLSLFALLGFIFAAYAVVANDSIQTLGTFISSNKEKTKWWLQWSAASLVLIFVLSWSWYTNSGDISYGRLSKIPLPEIGIGHVLAPLVLLILTKFGLPVSTTFLVLSAFATNVVLEKMITKSVVGYTVAAVSAYFLWLAISKILDEHKDVPESHKKWWRIAQWLSTGFLWSQWLAHDMANIAVYLPRELSFNMLLFVLAILCSGLCLIFYWQGGRIQRVIINKSGTKYIRSATIIDFFYAIILLVFKEMSDIPMSTTWVFVGLLCGRELAVYRKHSPKKSIKKVFPILVGDLFKIFIGLALSVIMALAIQYFYN